jgi:hypothetical protein
MSTAHTPGPWVVNDLYAETEIRGPQNSGAMICVMTPWGISADEPSPQRANARLIAAAPELLAALMLARTEIRALTAVMGGGLLTEKVLATADAAISQATGSEQ